MELAELAKWMGVVGAVALTLLLGVSFTVVRRYAGILAQIVEALVRGVEAADSTLDAWTEGSAKSQIRQLIDAKPEAVQDAFELIKSRAVGPSQTS